MTTSDVVLGLGPRSLVVLKDQISVLGPVLGLEGQVLGPVLGLEGQVLVNITGDTRGVSCEIGLKWSR